MYNGNVERLTAFTLGAKTCFSKWFLKKSYFVCANFKESNKNVMVIGCWAENYYF